MKFGRRFLFSFVLTLVVLSAQVALPAHRAAADGGTSTQGTCHLGSFCGG